MRNLLIILVLLNILDAGLSCYGISHNWFEEANPFMSWMGWRGMLGFKTLVITYAVFVLWISRDKRWVQAVTKGLVVVYAVVVGRVVRYYREYWDEYKKRRAK